MTENAYPKLGIAEKIFKSVIWDTTLRVSLTAFYIKVPFLGLPVIRNVFEFFVFMLSDFMFEGMRLVTDVTAIKIVNEVHRKAYEKSVVTLTIVANSNGVESDEYKKARDNAATHFAQFIRFGDTQ